MVQRVGSELHRTRDYHLEKVGIVEVSTKFRGSRLGAVHMLRHTFLGSLTPLGGYVILSVVIFFPIPWCFGIDETIYEQNYLINTNT